MTGIKPGDSRASRRAASRGWVVVALLLALPFQATAQEAQPDAGKLSTEQILKFLSSEKIVAPGVGFINGQIGDSMSYIFETWGEPKKARKVGFFGNREFMYQPDPDTLVVFTGDDEVKSISIRGTPASRISTRRGVRFGFEAVNILRLYSHHESETIRERIQFPGMGISFYFADNRVNTIVIFEPE